jgi:hypothetical protein
LLIALKKFFFALMILVLNAFLTGCDTTPRQERSFYGYYKLSETELNLIKDGDIILRQGQGFVSNLILKTLNEDLPLSHVGIITTDSLGDLSVIHSVSSTLSDFDGVQIQNLKSFVKESVPNSVVIVRYHQVNYMPESATEISKQAKIFLEQQIPFDHSFDYTDSTHFFCTELIWRVYKEVFKEELFKINPSEKLIEKLKFYHFFDSNKFSIILNHQQTIN